MDCNIYPKEVIAQSSDANKILKSDLPFHQWYRFVLSFPPHLVRQYLAEFSPRGPVLDPFCGTGTTLVECKRLGVHSVGMEANPMAAFASHVKTDWTPDPNELLERAETIAQTAYEKDPPPTERQLGMALESQRPYGLKGLSNEAEKLILKGSISPKPLHRVLGLLDAIETHGGNYRGHFRLALANSLKSEIGNLNFGPEVGVSKPKDDVDAVQAWFCQVALMAEDIRVSKSIQSGATEVLALDSRSAIERLEPRSIDSVITSPPYPNEKDYTRTTRLESVILGFVNNKEELRALKRSLVRSNTRGVYRQDNDDAWVKDHDGIQNIAKEIERRRIEMGKTSGFERLYPRVTKLYFGGMKRHLAALRPALKPGARLAYVVGDQASYLRVLIKTGEILSELAESLGYRTIRIDLFRTRLATATRQQMREEVVVLEWPRES